MQAMSLWNLNNLQKAKGGGEEDEKGNSYIYNYKNALPLKPIMDRRGTLRRRWSVS